MEITKPTLITPLNPLALTQPLCLNSEDVDLNSIPPLPLFMDSSMLSTLRACRRKFLITYMHNLKPKGSSIHLVAGAAWAAALDAARTAQYYSPDPLSEQELMEIAYVPFIKAWGDFTLESDHAKNIHAMLYGLELYFQKYHPYYDPVRPASIGGKPATEFSFAIPLDIKHPSGDPFIYVGRFDLLGVYRDNNLKVILDDKTTGSISTNWLNQWDMRGQFIGYVWACMKLGFDVETVLVRGTAFQKLDIKFADIPLPIPLHLVQKWERELYYSLEELMFLHSRGHFPWNFADSCASYGGCPNLNLCKSNRPENWLNNYEVSIWNPVAHEEG